MNARQFAIDAAGLVDTLEAFREMIVRDRDVEREADKVACANAKDAVRAAQAIAEEQIDKHFRERDEARDQRVRFILEELARHIGKEPEPPTVPEFRMPQAADAPGLALTINAPVPVEAIGDEPPAEPVKRHFGRKAA